MDKKILDRGRGATSGKSGFNGAKGRGEEIQTPPGYRDGGLAFNVPVNPAPSQKTNT